MSAFKVVESRKESSLDLRVFGTLDEDAKLPNINFAFVTNINVDFGGLTSINSCGIRDWIKWISHVKPSTKITYSTCPKIIVDQINMVEGFLPASGKVLSFFVPYYCENCDDVENNLFSTSDVGPAAGKPVPASTKCSKCGKDTEIDIIESKYMKFLSR
jgi:hypothetical protein